MIYQLPNGKSIEISIEQFLNMSDEDLKYLVYSNAGDFYNDPFTNTILKNNSTGIIDDEFEELSEDELKDLNDMSSEEKLNDLDYTPED